MYEELENLTKQEIENLYDEQMELDSLAWCKCSTSIGCLYIPTVQTDCKSFISGSRVSTATCYFSEWGDVTFYIEGAVSCRNQAAGIAKAKGFTSYGGSCGFCG